MNSDEDSQYFALGVVGGVVALVIALVIGVASWSLDDAGGNAAAPAAGVASAERIYFAVGSAALTDEAIGILARVAEAARARAGASVRIAGFHDASGNAAANEELAKQRAQTVRHVLEANGVDPVHLLLEKPAATSGGPDSREARRVEVRVE